MLDLAGIAENHRVAGNIAVDITVGRNQHVIANLDVSDNNGVDANPHLVAYRGRTHESASVGYAYHRTAMDVAIPTDSGFHVDVNVAWMSDVQARTYRHPWEYADSVFQTHPNQQSFVISLYKFVLRLLNCAEMTEIGQGAFDFAFGFATPPYIISL